LEQKWGIYAALYFSSGLGLLHGKVIFKDGDTTLDSGALDTSGQAVFTITTLDVGQHAITAQYGGDTNYTASTSAPLTQVVTSGVTVMLTNSQGVGIAGAVVQYYSGGCKSFGTTGADGRVSKQIASGTYSFRMNYA
jgi:hypothetical protein